MKVIFVPVADRPECTHALRTAFDFGHLLEANIVGCHIRLHNRSTVKMPAGIGSLMDQDAAWE